MTEDDAIIDLGMELLCDACLYKVETTKAFTVDELCDRCREKLLRYLTDLADQLEEQIEELDEQIRELDDQDS